MPAEEYSRTRAEIQLLQAWDVELTRFFQSLDPTAEVLPEGLPDHENLRGYRSRVGQDLKAFQEKLAGIMESKKSGQ